MQYDLKKVLENKELIKLTWHGADTRVRIEKNATKVDVEQGGTIAGSVKLADQLLRSSDLWTFEGDKPVEQGWREALAKAYEAREARAKARLNKRKRKSTPTEEAGDVDQAPDLSTARIGKMKVAEVKAALTHLEVEFDDKATAPELKELLLAQVEGTEENSEDYTATDDVQGDEEAGDEEVDTEVYFATN